MPILVHHLVSRVQGQYRMLVNIPVSVILFLATFSAIYAADWQLAWADEFNGPARSKPDPSKWKFDLGATGWGNHELEEYTDSLSNVFVDGKGHLAIRAIRAENSKYTSGRLKTIGLFEVQYGKIEAKIKIPFGQGIWPAFWMLGNDFKSKGWPACGEIDIMENIGREPFILHGTLHGPGYSGAHGITSQTSLPRGVRLASGFHIFGIEWSSDAVEFFLDRKSYSKATRRSLPTGTPWVFDHPFFLLLNLAVGGDWPGNPDQSTEFPQTLLVDWVRVWSSRINTGPTGK